MPTANVGVGELYDRHISAAWSLACAVCPDTACAERAIERTFNMIGQHGIGPGPRCLTRASLLSLVHRHALAEIRDSGVPPGPLGSLPEGQGEIVVLAYFGGLSVTQISQHLDIPSSAIRRLMRTALRALAPSRLSLGSASEG